MTRKILSALVAVLLIATLTACTPQIIINKKEQAKEIAFKHAGVAAADVYDLKAELDRDDGIESYEIEFKAARVEYEYDIHAGTGEILKSEKD